MGNTQSHHPESSLVMEQQPLPYPDMNVIFKGIPKMMQVADDMHRMTNYIMDLRNMTFAIAILSAVGMFLFILLKYIQGRQSRKNRRRGFHTNDSDESSLAGVGRPRGYSRSSHKHQHLDWNRHGMDMEKLIQSQHHQTSPHQKAYTLVGAGPTSDYTASSTTTSQSQPVNLLTHQQHHRESLPPQQHSQLSNGGTMIKVSSSKAA